MRNGAVCKTYNCVVWSYALRAGAKRYRTETNAAVKQRPITSPDDSPTSFMSEPSVGFLPAPVFLTSPPGLEESFRVLLEAVGGDLRLLMSEEAFYRLATSELPPFAEAVGQPIGDMTAGALFDVAGLQTLMWSFPADCFPELHIRARITVPTLPSLRRSAWSPGFNGELKTAGNRHGIEQAVVYTAMDMVRNFFPATATGPCPPQFFSLPPVGYAIVGYPHVAYVLALEWIGKLIVSPVSQPFLLGSPEHKAVVLGLVSPPYSEPVVLPLGVTWYAGSCSEVAVICSSHGGVFRKRVRAEARSAEFFCQMHRTYTALAPLLAVGTEPAPAPLPRNVRLLYGAHEVLVEMEHIPARGTRAATRTLPWRGLFLIVSRERLSGLRDVALCTLTCVVATLFGAWIRRPLVLALSRKTQSVWERQLPRPLLPKQRHCPLPVSLSLTLMTPCSCQPR